MKYRSSPYSPTFAKSERFPKVQFKYFPLPTQLPLRFLRNQHLFLGQKILPSRKGATIRFYEKAHAHSSPRCLQSREFLRKKPAPKKRSDLRGLQRCISGLN